MLRPFVSEPADIERIKNSNPYIVHEALTKAGSFSKLDPETKEIAMSLFGELWNPDGYKSGIYKLYGWLFNFQEWMKLYYVKVKWCGIEEVYSFNKTTIRKNAVKPSDILRITEITD